MKEKAQVLEPETSEFEYQLQGILGTRDNWLNLLEAGFA